ncbi:MAG TPA: PadR family transcriptional regulator [Actinomycetota bacterium]
MLELAVLGLLKEKPMYGYEVKKRLEERLGHAWKFSYGSVYPTLGRLERDDAIEVQADEGASRRKKIYRITPAGESMFETLLEEGGSHATEDREAFLLRLAFFRYTRPETRRRLLERRRSYLLDQLERMKASLVNLKERVDNYSLELMRYGERETEHEISWLDTQLEVERRADVKARVRAKKKAVRKAERSVRRTERAARPPAAVDPHAAIERG